MLPRANGFDGAASSNSSSMSTILNRAASDPREQFIVLLLAALHDLKNGARTKQEVLLHIKESGWLDIHPNDKRPYPSQPSEPRWNTEIAFARLHSVQSGLMEKNSNNMWQATKHGLNTYMLSKKTFSVQSLLVCDCYFWTPIFKTRMDPHYSPSDKDAVRPKYLYEDDLPWWQKSVRGSIMSRAMDNLLG